MPAHTTVSLPATITTLPYACAYAMSRWYALNASVPELTSASTCCLFRNWLNGFVTTNSSDQSCAIFAGSLARNAHTSLACVLFAFDWEWHAAEREFRAAIQLDPGYGLAHHRYGLFLMYQQRFDEAQQVLESARASDPLAPSVTMNLGRLHLSAHRPERAVPLLQKAIELSPHLVLAHEQVGHAYLQLNAKTEALAAFRRVAELSGPRGTTRLAYALAATGEHAAARSLIAEIAARPDAAVHAFGLAMAYAGLRDNDSAFAWLDRAHAARDAFLHTALIMPAFEPLHSDARWKERMRGIGLDHIDT